MAGRSANDRATTMCRTTAAILVLAAATLLFIQVRAHAGEPIKVGFSMAMTGGVAQNGKQLLIDTGGRCRAHSFLPQWHAG